MKKQKLIHLVLLTLLMITCDQVVNAQRITVTIAGSGTAGYSGDGGWGKYAVISSPYDVCTDAAKNIYFTDTGNGRIRKVSVKDGRISTVAGGGTSTAEGIPAKNAVLAPKNMCIDATGNLYVVASSNSIRKIDAATGTIMTIAGTAIAGYSGDGGLAMSATFNGIAGICVDISGNLYVVDEGNFCIRKIAAATGLVTTIAGTPGVSGFTGDGGLALAATLNSPTAITVNAAGDVFFMDQSDMAVFNAQFRKITAATGMINTLAGGVSGGSVFGVPLMSTWLADVTGLCMDGDGNFYCNEVSCSCRKLNMTTDSSYAVGGDFYTESFSDNVNSNLSYMDNPYGICMDAAQNLYTADNANNRIRKLIQLTNTPTFAYGKGAYIFACPGTTVSFDSLLTITDLDAGQTETFTVISAPAHGTLSGFPAAVTSNGTVGISRPAGVSYTAGAYAGSDSFRVQVSDGALTDTFTLYIDAGAAPITGVNTLCAGSSVPLNDASADEGGAWTMTNTNATISASGVVTGATGGMDTAMYSVTNSCGVVTAALPITVNSLPDAGAIVSPSADVCSGSYMVVTDDVGGGIWHTSNSHAAISSAGTITAISPGTDTVFYTVVNSCGNTTASEVVAITHCSTTGVVSIAYPVPAIFPSPASSSLNIQWDALLTGNANISIADMLGRVVMNSDVNTNGGNITTVDVSGLKTGIYMVTISNTAEHYTDKIGINR